MHRRGLHHGALHETALTFEAGAARLHHLGRRLDGTVAEDLHALGLLADRVTRGGADGSHLRRRVSLPAPLDGLLASLTHADPSQRPASADAVLSALDWFPASDQSTQQMLVEGNTGRGGRPPGHRQATMLLGVTALLLLLLWLLVQIR
jgi:hypothetical protein